MTVDAHQLQNWELGRQALTLERHSVGWDYRTHPGSEENPVKNQELGRVQWFLQTRGQSKDLSVMKDGQNQRTE